MLARVPLHAVEFGLLDSFSHSRCAGCKAAILDRIILRASVGLVDTCFGQLRNVWPLVRRGPRSGHDLRRARRSGGVGGAVAKPTGVDDVRASIASRQAAAAEKAKLFPRSASYRGKA